MHFQYRFAGLHDGQRMARAVMSCPHQSEKEITQLRMKRPTPGPHLVSLRLLVSLCVSCALYRLASGHPPRSPSCRTLLRVMYGDPLWHRVWPGRSTRATTTWRSWPGEVQVRLGGGSAAGHKRHAGQGAARRPQAMEGHVQIKREHHVHLGVVTGRGKWTSYVEGQIRLGLDQNFIYILLDFIKGANKIMKWSVGWGPLLDLCTLPVPTPSRSRPATVSSTSISDFTFGFIPS
jgi:hypothetical protein